MDEKTNDIEGNSNLEFRGNISKRFQDMFSQTLIYLEIAFPHEKGDGSDNERIFNSLRSKILRTGNDNIRELDRILESYVVFKLYEYKPILNKKAHTDVIVFKNKFLIGGTDGNREGNNNR